MMSTSSPSSDRSTVGSSITVTTVGSNAAHSTRVRASGSGGMWMTAVPRVSASCTTSAGPAPAARREPIPHRDQHVAMRNGRPAGHHISVDCVVEFARKLEDAGCALEQLVEALLRGIVSEGLAILRALEGEHRLKLPSELQRDFGGNLVGAVRDRRYEPQLLRVAGEAGAFHVEELGAGILDQVEDVGNPRPQRRYAAFGQHLNPMAGHSDAEDEGRARGAGRNGRLSGPHAIVCSRLCRGPSAVVLLAAAPVATLPISAGPGRTPVRSSSSAPAA